MRFTPSRRQLLQTAGASALLAGIGRQALAQAGMPDLARIAIGFAAGGTSDTAARRIAQSMTGQYARSVVVDNRTGAGGQIAVTTVRSTPADGLNLLQTPTSILTIYPHIYSKLPYDPVADLTPVTVCCVFDFGFAVGPSVPASVRTVPEFLQWAKANPAGANFGSPAAGSTPHFIGALLGKRGAVELKHAAYRGTQPAMLDLIGGNISAVSGPIGDITQHLATGKVRMLGVSGDKRSRFVPDVRTFAEQGIQGATHSEWFAYFLPARAPADVVNRANSAIRAALQQKEVIDGMATFGLEAMGNSPTELAELLRRDTAKWAPIVKEIGFRAD